MVITPSPLTAQQIKHWATAFRLTLGMDMGLHLCQFAERCEDAGLTPVHWVGIFPMLVEHAQLLADASDAADEDERIMTE